MSSFSPQLPSQPEWRKTKRTEWIDTAGVPEWVTTGYNDNPIGLRIAVERWRTPHTTAADRASVAVFRLGASHPCMSCGRGRFPQPTVCYWCRRGR